MTWVSPSLQPRDLLSLMFWGETKAQKQSAEEGDASSGSFGSDPLPPRICTIQNLPVSLLTPAREEWTSGLHRTDALCQLHPVPCFQSCSHQVTQSPAYGCPAQFCPTLHPMETPTSYAHPCILCIPLPPLPTPTSSAQPRLLSQPSILCLPLHPLFKREYLALSVGGSIQ